MAAWHSGPLSRHSWNLVEMQANRRVFDVIVEGCRVNCWTVSCVEWRRRKNRTRLKTGRHGSAAVSEGHQNDDENGDQDDDQDDDHNHVSVVTVIIASLLVGLWRSSVCLYVCLSACISQLDGCIVWNAHNTVLSEEALVIYVIPVCYVKTGRYGKT